MKFVCLKYPRIEMTYKPDVKKEVNGEILRIPREVIKFENGFYETEDEKQIAFIKRHTDFGNGNICVVEQNEVLEEKATPEEEAIIEKHRGRPKKVV